MSVRARLVQLSDRFAQQRRETSMLAQFANIDEYMRNYGRDFRDFYSADGRNKRDEMARALLPLGWNFYRKDNLDFLLAECRAKINPAASMDELLEILQYVFNQYQAQIATNPQIALNEEQTRSRLADMNCKVLRMYSRKFELWLPGVFDYQQFRRNPNVHLRDGRNQPIRPIERDRRRDMTTNLPVGLVLRKPASLVHQERKKAAWLVQHDTGFSTRVARAFSEPERESFLAARNRPPGAYIRPRAATALLRP